jgi:hypothetical protein
MQQRNLGSQGLVVSELGFGCMGMSEYYGTGDDAESVATLHRALDLGVTFFDTAADYGLGDNERLVRGAELGDMKLEYADLSGADLTGANLKNANLSGANLEGAKGLKKEDLEQAVGDGTTKIARKLRPEA